MGRARQNPRRGGAEARLNAEKIAVSICVLVFFWGLFFPMRMVSSQPPCRDFTNLGYLWIRYRRREHLKPQPHETVAD